MALLATHGLVEEALLLLDEIARNNFLTTLTDYSKIKAASRQALFDSCGYTSTRGEATMLWTFFRKMSESKTRAQTPSFFNILGEAVLSMV